MTDWCLLHQTNLSSSRLKGESRQVCSELCPFVCITLYTNGYKATDVVRRVTVDPRHKAKDTNRGRYPNDRDRQPDRCRTRRSIKWPAVRCKRIFSSRKRRGRPRTSDCLAGVVLGRLKANSSDFWLKRPNRAKPFPFHLVVGIEHE